MSAPEQRDGWSWLDTPPVAVEPDAQLCQAAAACFATPGGRVLVQHLGRAFREGGRPPTASDAELRHVEGQRSVVAHLVQLVERGREAADRPGPNVAEFRDLR